MARARTSRTAGGRKSGSPIDDFIALPDAEKERHAAAFDREFVADEARPLTAAQRKLWAKARRKPGRPKVGQGVKTIALSIEKGLLKRADAEARRRKISRATLVALGLQSLLPPTSKAG